MKRTRTGTDILEHAMKGVRCFEHRGRISNFHSEVGLVGLSSGRQVRMLSDTVVEREVIVRLPDRRKSR